MKKINIVLVEDHEIVREGIKLLLSKSKEISIIGDVGDGVELFELLKHKKPDLIMLDIELPGMTGIEITKIIKNDYPSIKILVLSMSVDESTIFFAVKSGVNGFVHKNIHHDELISAIKLVNSGKEYYSQKVTDIMLRSYTDKVKSGINIESHMNINLSAREREILNLIKEGFTNAQIAEKTSLSIRTVEGHKERLKKKLKLKKSSELMRFALLNNYK